jgi:hypothetical protein
MLNRMSQQSDQGSAVMPGRGGGNPSDGRPSNMSSYETFSGRGWELKSSVISIGLGALLFASGSMGDTFEIIEGKGKAVCEAYLSAVQKLEPDDMGCLADRPLEAKGIARISAPIWQIENSTVENGPATN